MFCWDTVYLRLSTLILLSRAVPHKSYHYLTNFVIKYT